MTQTRLICPARPWFVVYKQDDGTFDIEEIIGWDYEIGGELPHAIVRYGYKHLTLEDGLTSNFVGFFTRDEVDGGKHRA